MGKTSRWLRNILTKKDKDKDEKKTRSCVPSSAKTPGSMLKEKRRWSFLRSVGSGKELNSTQLTAAVAMPVQGIVESDMDQKKQAMAVAVATAAAADAAVAAAQAAAAVVRLTTTSNASLTGADEGASRSDADEDAAAIKIQSAFRSYLARKALHALKGLVKLQALVRGHLVRKQATATLRCMQALITAQARARAQRIHMLEEAHTVSHRQHPNNRRSPQHPRFRQSYEMERSVEENVKIVEMDLGESRGSFKSRSSYSITQSETTEHGYSAYGGSRPPSKADPYQQVSPVPSALTDMSPRTCSGHFEDFCFTAAKSSPHYFPASNMPDATKSPYIVSHQDGTYSMSNDYPFPSYMANTQSSRAKARAQSAPKQRPELCERQPSRRRPIVEGRNIPRSGRMQRSSSHVGASLNGYQYPWPIKLDKSNVSLKDSECGSTSTVCRTLVF